MLSAYPNLTLRYILPQFGLKYGLWFIDISIRNNDPHVGDAHIILPDLANVSFHSVKLFS